MEQKTMTTPAWVDEMRKWQNEDNEHRSVLCVAVDNDSSFSVLDGSCLSLIAALTAVMKKNPDWANICEIAVEAKKAPSASIALLSILESVKKMREEATEENEGKPDAPSIKESLQTILSKLADKL